MRVVAVPGVVQYLLGPGSTWRDVGLAFVDLAVVGYLIYRVLLLIRGTRAINVLVGLFLLGIGYLGSQWANLVTLNWLLGHFLSYSFIFGVIVLFQADIRRGLAHLGRGSVLLALVPDEQRAQVGLIDCPRPSCSSRSSTRAARSTTARSCCSAGGWRRPAACCRSARRRSCASWGRATALRSGWPRRSTRRWWWSRRSGARSRSRSMGSCTEG